ncbi:bifunctional hydroxymethylpyrimidine kinase/phosphomethylpyrimidine kinase [Cytobacillus purgationiresistens]|uniref:Hydroxymethylpyrimidine/phosphomethylpyrimidine kinase n=1 Tax=Cytobacillus purgationiresistens TaxID=863449 RepID=A0ABU0AEH6_9BACI|nr:bifunctional hydroxymethylpyrimidine kinase/phosphomethylpyrimidine kinase [Cytobacillus purgationiresistens]MDQ0268490.1 hydroxymethylpyrimidine/phosphomethylpyrimidine kinase [Cytobacillus purgationiresistens]
MKTALTIAGSDSGGGAGIQADLKSFAANGVYGMSVITAITAQNTVEVRSVQDIDLPIVKDQISAVLDDIQVDAVKIGMLSSEGTVEVVAKELIHYQPRNIVLDPVMISKGGHHLLREQAMEALILKMLPLATLITPNIPEAEVITNRSIKTKEDMKAACIEIHALGPAAVLLKGGHLEGEPEDLLYDGNDFYWIAGKRIHTKNTHGTGCTLSSAIAANLAKDMPLLEAVKEAKKYILIAIENSLELGNGHGPTHHFYDLYEKAGLYRSR